MKNTLNGNNKLKREIGLFSATILVIANMVGTGIFTTSGFIMAELGSPGIMLLCWLCGGLFALCGALCYGELGSRFPRAGGEYVFLRESFGRPMAFLSGWISLVVGFSAPIAAAAIAFATYGFRTFGAAVDGGWRITLGDVDVLVLSSVTLTAVAVILMFSLVHYHSLTTGSRVQNALTLFKVIFIVVFICAGFWFGKGSVDHFFQSASTEGGLAERFAVSLIFISFAFSGWNAAAYLGGEIKAPQMNIPLSLFIGTALVIGLYLLLNGVYIYALPVSAMSGVLEVGAVSATALFGDSISRLFIGAVALGILSVLSAMIMAGPRVYYAMAVDDAFFDCFGRVNSKHKTPAAAIFLQAGIAMLMVITTSFNALLVYIGFTLALFAMLTVVGLMKIRRTHPPQKSGYQTFGYPLTPLLFILGNAWIIVFSIKSRPLASLFGLATIGIGVLAYRYFVRHRGRRRSC
ncbi:MAG: amino acid permease [Thermodesulfobacteriota bacterium]|nr:amino acid permease [Thermodesulfobacteriota bacterium]